METDFIEIRLPGSIICDESHKKDFESYDHVEAVIMLFYEACAALCLFEEIQNEVSPSLIDQCHSERAGEIFGNDMDGHRQTPEKQRRLFLEAESRAKIEQWDRGVLPCAITKHRIKIAARAFVYALDGFRDEIIKIAKSENASIQLKAIPKKFEEYFPHLKAIRDSSHHIADRRRGMGRVGNKSGPFKAKSHDYGFMEVPEGTIQLAMLNDSNFGCTLADGSYGSIEIDSSALRFLRRLVDELVGCYEWDSHPITYPLR